MQEIIFIRNMKKKMQKKRTIRNKRKKQSIWDLPQHAVTMEISDASINHDKYIYDVSPHDFNSSTS
jgi:hypothetical protein